MKSSDTVRRRLIPAWTCFVLALSALPPYADEVTVKGVRLSGTVKEVKPSGVVFETEFGSGTIEIPYAEIQSLVTDEEIVILFGDEGRIAGKLVGVVEGDILVGDRIETAARVAPGTIVRSRPAAQELTFSEAIRDRYRFWQASVDLGLSFKDATTDQTNFTAGARIERRKKPTRLLLEGSHIYGREKAKGEPSSKTNNEIRGLVKGEWDPFERFFVYTAHDLEYDELEALSLRWVAKAGPAYRIFESERVRWQVETGAAYTYERFFGGDVEETVGAVFGTEGSIGLFGGAVLDFRADYIPSLEDWTDDYLIRAQASLSVPISAYLAFKTTVFESYDSTPAEGIDKNDVKVILSLSWRF